jgi:hypothetical protein
MNIKTTMLALAVLTASACSETYLVQTNAPLERNYAVKRCAELGVQMGDPAYEQCLEEKGIARWALKNCGGSFGSIQMWYPTLCKHADDD